MSRKYWSKEEMLFIKNHIDIMSISDFVNYFNVPKNKIIDKIHKMGLNSKKSRGILWTKEEDLLLRKHFEYAPKNYIQKLFPNRSWCSIVQRGHKTLLINRKVKDVISVDYNFFSNQWNEENAYIVGFILADGHIHLGTNNFLQIEVHYRDKDILYKIKRILSYEGNLIKRTSSNSIKLQIKNKKIIEDLVKKGIPLKNKSYTAMFPKVPSNLIKHCIRGLIDGDGYISQENKTKRISLGLCGTYDLCEVVKNYFPIDCSRIKIIKGTGKSFRFKVSGEKALKVLSWLYDDANIYLDRKYNKYKNILNS